MQFETCSLVNLAGGPAHENGATMEGGVSTQPPSTTLGRHWIDRVRRRLGVGVLGATLATAVVLSGCGRTESVQGGPRGGSQLSLYSPKKVAAGGPENFIPDPEPVDPPEPDSPPLKDIFKNVQVLNDLTALEFSRLMQAMSTWIAPEQGCEFCHNPKKLDSDEKYTKVVARRMLQMTRAINTDWKQHVAGTGVTCWTCHRGQAVPSGDWFANIAVREEKPLMGYHAMQNRGGVTANGNAALPADALSAFLDGGTEVRIQGTRALAGQRHDSVKQAEWTYSLMMYMAQSLGVNCTYCHNTRALANWKESTPQRVTAWYGIRMVRYLNNDYLNPLKPLFPDYRLSPQGDGPKVGCETCHKGWFKPLKGVTMLNDYPELRGVMVREPAEAASAAAAAAAPEVSKPRAAAPAPAPASTKVAAAGKP